MMINVIISSCIFFVLIKSSLEDFEYRNLFSLYIKFRVLFIVHPFLLIISFFAYLFGNAPITLFLICISILIFIGKSHAHTSSFSLESHYESLLYLGLLALAFDSNSALFFISSCILICSVSAGYAKLISPIWTTNPIGMSVFLSLPWLARAYSRKLSKTLSGNKLLFKLTEILTKLVPLMQFFSALILLSSYIVRMPQILQPLIYFAFAFQIIFPILLLIFSGLGMIPFQYLILVLSSMYASNTAYIFANPFDNITIIAFIFFFIYLISSFGGISKGLSRKLTPFIRKGPFHMFTERNIMGMIVFHINSQAQPSNNCDINHSQPFLESGYRSSYQNFHTTKFFTLYYTLMDILILNSNRCQTLNISDLSYKSDFQYRSLHNLLEFFNPHSLSFVQFSYLKETSAFQSSNVANLIRCSDRYSLIYNTYKIASKR